MQPQGMMTEFPDGPPPRYPSRAAEERLRDLLRVPFDGWMQDWPLEASDATRLGEFCDAYDSGDSGDSGELGELGEQERFALMRLILFSLDDVAGDERAAALAERVEGLLRRNFLLHLHTLDYWRLPDSDEDGQDGNDVFTLTPMARQVWSDCYRHEYGRWLHD